MSLIHQPRTKSLRWIRLFLAAQLLGSVITLAKTADAKSAEKTKLSKTPELGRVLTAMSTPLAEGHPMLLLQSDQREEINTQLKFADGSRYSKWSVVFESNVRVDEVEVTACQGTKGFDDGVELFLDFDEKRLFADGGRMKVKFLPRADVRMLTLSFLESESLCLSSIALKTGGKPTGLYVPEVVKTKGDWQLGDGRLGGFTPLSTSKSAKLRSWELAWERDLIVEGLRVWNGNQHLGEAFLDSGRVHELVIKTNSGLRQLPSETLRVNLEDRRGNQKIDFKKALPLRSLELIAAEKFEGGIIDEPIIGEVQLLAGGLAWIPWAGTEVKGNSASEGSLRAIREAGFSDVLDRELRIEGKTDVWKFRFRSDGTVAAQVFTERARTARKWTFMGSWLPAQLPTVEQKETSKPSGVFARIQAKSQPLPNFGMRIVGVRYSSADFADSIPCGNQCFSSNGDRGPSAIRELPVNELIEIQRESKTYFYLRNRTPSEQRTLDFSDLKMRFHSLYN